MTLPPIDEDRIIAEHINGRSARAIAKAEGCSVAQVNHVIDAWAAEAIDDHLRTRSLYLELERLDQLTEVFLMGHDQRSSRPGLFFHRVQGVFVAETLTERRRLEVTPA
jgi:hypothetical protein